MEKERRENPLLHPPMKNRLYGGLRSGHPYKQESPAISIGLAGDFRRKSCDSALKK